jgi:hypothetical protein
MFFIFVKIKDHLVLFRELEKKWYDYSEIKLMWLLPAVDIE